jgi:hypothetical protein
MEKLDAEGTFAARPCFVQESGQVRMGIASAPVELNVDPRHLAAAHVAVLGQKRQKDR